MAAQIIRPLSDILAPVLPARFQPMARARRAEPFSHPDWLYEIEHDGFRALAYMRDRRCELVSRNGNAFKSFPGLCELLGRDLKVPDAVLDGEIVCLAADGRSVFNDVLFRRAEPFFYAFDVLWAGSEDLRFLPLHERKHRLRAIIKPHTSRLLYLDHIEERGEDFFHLACAHDLEGIVAKHKYSPYLTDGSETSWIKLKNRGYSQMFGRDELFKHRHEGRQRMRTTDGWAGCTLVCTEGYM